MYRYMMRMMTYLQCPCLDDEDDEEGLRHHLHHLGSSDDMINEHYYDVPEVLVGTNYYVLISRDISFNFRSKGAFVAVIFI